MILHGLDRTAARDKRGDEEIKNGFHGPNVHDRLAKREQIQPA